MRGALWSWYRGGHRLDGAAAARSPPTRGARGFLFVMEAVRAAVVIGGVSSASATLARDASTVLARLLAFMPLLVPGC